MLIYENFMLVCFSLIKEKVILMKKCFSQLNVTFINDVLYACSDDRIKAAKIFDQYSYELQTIADDLWRW
uniref:Uncharacterized protein n=1 Tax=Ascaris lumbricoides TaxID=6252 RepID=A0A0M3I2B5_ASCLU